MKGEAELGDVRVEPTADDFVPSTDSSEDVIVLIPVFNDWESVVRLVEMIDGEISGWPVRILIVNDGSTESSAPLQRMADLGELSSVDVLELGRNVGHQRAIAIGLSFLETNLLYRAVVVMDGDGEDAPSDIPRLLDELDRAGDSAVVFAERLRRSESWLFRVGYFAYRALHRPLTGLSVKFGNFSVLPRQLAASLVLSPDLWNHYAAAVVNSRFPIRLVPTKRARRLAGRSRMSPVSLVTHGFSAMAVFGDRVAVRLLAATGVLTGLLVVGAAVVIGIKGPGDWGALWGESVFLVVALGVTQILVVLLIFVFLVLHGRGRPGFIPLRDHAVFVREMRNVLTR